MDHRFKFAMGAYAALALLSFVTLSGKIRLATLILLALFAVKTILHVLRKRQEEKPE